ncbi:hypothetical protein GcM3_057012 [Golovinomyces cichoracearum]|uniref:Uncharacterized protein n=1 Tax=Golovinomyces cichoracearum TaxID=62708 RepID=A0A420IXD4_9PEZI|nr:hypothetical protein GcM3_057012 [Golovinomyces cichoracearum]
MEAGSIPGRSLPTEKGATPTQYYPLQDFQPCYSPTTQRIPPVSAVACPLAESHSVSFHCIGIDGKSPAKLFSVSHAGALPWSDGLVVEYLDQLPNGVRLGWTPMPLEIRDCRFKCGKILPSSCGD